MRGSETKVLAKCQQNVSAWKSSLELYIAHCFKNEISTKSQRNCETSQDYKTKNTVFFLICKK